MWRWVVAEWPQRHPADPMPFLTEVHRPAGVQAALFAQGRQPLAEVNRLRGLVKLAPISEAENRRTVTNARPGQSKHEHLPSLAVDIWFQRNRKLVDDDRLWQQLVRLIREHDATIKWGGHFRFVDKPHFEI